MNGSAPNTGGPVMGCAFHTVPVMKPQTPNVLQVSVVCANVFQKKKPIATTAMSPARIVRPKYERSAIVAVNVRLSECRLGAIGPSGATAALASGGAGVNGQDLYGIK